MMEKLPEWIVFVDNREHKIKICQEQIFFSETTRRVCAGTAQNKKALTKLRPEMLAVWSS